MASRFNKRRKRDEDLLFMAHLKVATLEELQELRGRYALTKDAPLWKKIAIQRAIERWVVYYSR